MVRFLVNPTRVALLATALCVILLPCSESWCQATRADSLFTAAEKSHDRAMSLVRRGEKEAALRAFYESTDDFRSYQSMLASKADSIRPKFETLRNSDPSSPVYWYLAGRMFLLPTADSAGAEKARPYFEKVIAIEPHFAWGYMGLASTFSAVGNLPEAGRCYQSAIEADSTFEDAYEWLISTYDRAGRQTESIALRRKLSGQDSSSRLGSYSLLDLARRSNEPRQREDLLWRAISHATEAWIKSTACQELLWHLQKEDPPRAEALARTLLATTPASDRYLRQSAYLAIFESYKRTRRDHIPAFAEELALESDPRILGTVGVFLADSLEDFPAAIACLLRGYHVCTKENAEGRLIVGSGFTEGELERVSANYRDGFLAPSLGWAYYRLKDLVNAERFLQESVKTAVQNTNPVPLYRLGYVLAAKGDKKGAIECLSQGLAMKDDGEALATLERLVAEEKIGPKAVDIIRTERLKDAKLAPDFTLVSLSGDSVHLASLKGKVVMIDFWATWCGPCVAELPHLQKLYSKHSGNPGVVFLSIDTNEPRAVVQDFMRKKGYMFTVLLDLKASAQNLYGVEAIPAKFLIDKDGKIQFKHIGGGNDPKVVDDLTKEIDELLAGS